MTAWLRYSKRRLLGALMVLSLATALFGQGLASQLRSAVHVLIAPFGDGGMYVVTSLKTGGGAGSDLSPEEVRRLVEENEQYQRQLAEADHRMAAREQEFRSQMESLQGLVGGSFQPRGDIPCELIPARVVAADAMPYRQGRVVNRGASAGAARGAPVLAKLLMTDRSKDLPPNLAVVTASSLVGRVESAGPFTAYVRLVTDAGFSLSAQIVRRIDPDRRRWIKVLTKDAAAEEPLTERNNRPVKVQAAGNGVGGLIAHTYEYERILPGDWLMTRDDDPYLRTEVRVGVVEEVTPLPADPGQVTVRVKPFEDFASLRNVFIVYWKPP